MGLFKAWINEGALQSEMHTATHQPSRVDP